MTTIDYVRVPAFYHKYIQLVQSNDLSAALQRHQIDLLGTLRKIDNDRWDYRYAPGKWSIKEVVQHIIDAERIFSYRALTFARGDKNELPGFDQNPYVENADADKRSKADLIEETATVQKSSLLLFQSFGEQQLGREGIANGNSIYVAGLGFIIAGHALHHRNILVDRYGAGE